MAELRSLDIDAGRVPLKVAGQLPLFGMAPKAMPLDAPTVLHLMRRVPAMAEQATCLEALDRFHADPQLIAIPVVNEAQYPVALIDRYTFVEFLSRLYSRELFGRRSLRQMLIENTGNFRGATPVVVDGMTTIDDVAQIIIGEGMQHMVSGVAVTSEGVYAGLLSGHDLLGEITHRKQADLFYLAHFDSLTHLPNRMLFTDRLTQACREAQRKGTVLALMFVDVDRFKQVNDSFGHQVGDLLLQSVTQRLLACMRECETLARLGGDEFAILMEEVSSSDDASVLAGRLVDAMSPPFLIHGREILVTLSIGVAHFPGDDTDIEALLSKADAAMYAVKRNGRNGFHAFQPGLTPYSAQRLQEAAELKRALEQDEFFLVYQPQVSLRTGEVTGVEALIRWRHPERGVLTPAHFIALAEETGLIVPLGEWVLLNACRQQCCWQRHGLPSLRIAVNISALQFRQPDFAARVANLLRESEISPALLELELTESMVMEASSSIQSTLDALRQLGVCLSLDDFGTGFSSLGYLRRFPIDRLKIDQSFVRDVDHTPVNASIVQAVVALARSLGMEVVAEGVENEAELAFVAGCGCDESQGYWHARPMSGPDLRIWVQEYDSLRDTRTTAVSSCEGGRCHHSERGSAPAGAEHTG